MEPIIATGDLNNINGGVCREIVYDWIGKGLNGSGIQSLDQFRSSKEYFDLRVANTQLKAAAMEASFGIKSVASSVNRNAPVSTQWIAEKMTKGTGYFLLGLLGKSLSLDTAGFEGTGHALGSRKYPGKPFQFFDPNVGLWEFDNTLKFYDWLPGFINETYPQLLSQACFVRQYT